MSNFRFLLSDPGFSSFADVAVAAERILHIDPAACILNCRRSMEFAIKWMYSVDDDLVMPDQDNLLRLMSQKDFRAIVGNDLWKRMDLIRRKGNTAAHDEGKISESAAMLCLENLHAFLDFVAYCYGEDHKETTFDPSLIPTGSTFDPRSDNSIPSPDLTKLIEENKKLKAQLTARREEHRQTYIPKPLELSEYETRKFYIDAMLEDAGWTEGVDWKNEVEVRNGTPDSEPLTADYVLYDDDGIPLAIIEALRTCADPYSGIPRARLCAEALGKQFRRRPVIFLTNGFDIHILPDNESGRMCSDLYSKKDLEKLFRIRNESTPLRDNSIASSIADRYYQTDAIRAVCHDLEEAQRRKALLVMASGTGKTRTVIALCDILLRHKKSERILYLSHGHSLLTQAKRGFEEFLPLLNTATLGQTEDIARAQCVFSTYDRMITAIDDLKNNSGKLFTCGYFDLVIWDEVHPSIYNQYREVFRYFDATVIGLTSTPRSEISNTVYEIFDCPKGEPTYTYEPARAVRDGYLVDFLSVKTGLNAPDSPVSYEDLPEKERQKWENTFTDPHQELPEKVLFSALNRWIFNDDIICQGLRIVMEEGLKLPGESLPGKTILFAKNHNHAQKILEIFNKEYPNLPDFAQIIDGQSKNVQALIDRFADPKSLPRIALSVDLLDTGIDIPSCVNLVFFKRVMSKERFRQMIGRGSRPCPGLQGGKDKDRFYIFDFCGNFEFFRLSEAGSACLRLSVPGLIFSVKVKILDALQKLKKPTDEIIAYTSDLIRSLVAPVQALSRDHFAVRQHLKCVELYSNPGQYQTLTEDKLSQLLYELAPLLPGDNAQENILLFDALMYATQLAFLTNRGKDPLRSQISKILHAMSSQHSPSNSPAETALLRKFLQKDALKKSDLRDLEQIRTELREKAAGIPGELLSMPQEFMCSNFPDTSVFFT